MAVTSALEVISDCVALETHKIVLVFVVSEIVVESVIHPHPSPLLSTLRSIALPRVLARRSNLRDLESNATSGATEDGPGEGESSSDALKQLATE